MNAIELLKKDHQKVAGLFKQYENAGQEASAKKEELFARIKQELDVHARIEEEIFYPAARQVAVEEAKELVAEAAEEHKQIKTLLAELDGMDADDEQFDAKMKVLKEDVEHHVEEEENELFPKVKKALGSDRLEDLGRQLEYRRQSLATAASVETSDDDDEEDEDTAAGAGTREPGTRVRGSSSDSRDDASFGSMREPRPGSRSRSRSGSMGRARPAMGGGSARSRSGSGPRASSRAGSSGRSRSSGRPSRGRSRSSGSRTRSSRSSSRAGSRAGRSRSRR